jgi:hypothetical protein
MEARLGEVDVAISGQPETATVEMVSGDYFRVLGSRPWLAEPYR